MLTNSFNSRLVNLVYKMGRKMTSLRLILRLNAASCIGFGALLLLAPGAVAAALGTPPALLLQALGAGLLVNAAHLLWEARLEHPGRLAVLWFSTGDLLWWLATIALVASGLWITTPFGQTWALLIGAGVAGLGAAQMFALGQRSSGLAARGLWRRLGQSWLAMPLWVKLWLFALNGVFLAALAFWPAPVATLTLLSFVASGPLLLGMAALQGGLTRALGLAHLVTFTPLLWWLLPQAGFGGAEAIYALVLSGGLAICLGFDIWDLVRYSRGDRAPLGFSNPGGASAAS
jgi:hypothetical protein